jgi:hypothetical protein
MVRGAHRVSKETPPPAAEYHWRVAYRERSPSAALAPYVEAFWTIDTPSGAPSHRVLPDGCMDLLFDASGGRIVGAMTRAVVVPPLAPGALLFAADLSFADQAHLVREVGQLAGTTPIDLLGERRAVSDLFNPRGRVAATVPPSPALPARRKERP